MSRNKHFSETMSGTWRRKNPEGEGGFGEARPFSFSVNALIDSPIKPLGTVVAEISGVLEATSLAQWSQASGVIEMSPIATRRIRYKIHFQGDDGRNYFFDGWKSISWIKPLSTWTTLPGTIYDVDGNVFGVGDVKFDLRKAAQFIKSFGFEARALESQRSDGKKGRLEVWYDTFSDVDTKIGYWLHHEIVTPLSGPAYAHGWIAIFEPGIEPVLERFGPLEPKESDAFDIGDVSLNITSSDGNYLSKRIGNAGSISWD